MKYLIIIFLIIFNGSLYSRETGQTEITAEDGVEVFQKEKYYLLKKNVKIISDDFTLNGDEVKMYFDKDLYDIKEIESWGNVSIQSNKYDVFGEGDHLIFLVITEDLLIEGVKSKLLTNNMEMFSDGVIKINNLSGQFSLTGPNSILNSEDININGEKINGIFADNAGTNEILELSVYDKNLAYIKSDNTDMYAINAVYDKKTSIIELEDEVKIIRDGETITGDYGTLDTESQSYQVKSRNSNKVKVIIISDENE